jgi:phosphoglycolate phosphatase-like HAD superfamily hydrolase
MPLSHVPFQAAIVDLDGTMVDTVGDFEVALARALADLGHRPVSRAFISRTVGKGSEHLIQRSLAEAGAPAELYEQAWADTSTTTWPSTGSTRPSSRAWSLACKRSVRLGCAWLA